MSMWTAQTQVAGRPDDVMTLLTEPDAIARWAPIPFEVLDPDCQRLLPGDKLRVRGALAGRALEFHVAVSEADDARLALSAVGPIRLEVEYSATRLDSGSELRASIAVSGKGLFGRVLAQATDALLAAGALSTAVGRVARELEPALAA